MRGKLSQASEPSVSWSKFTYELPLEDQFTSVCAHTSIEPPAVCVYEYECGAGDTLCDSPFGPLFLFTHNLRIAAPVCRIRLNWPQRGELLKWSQNCPLKRIQQRKNKTGQDDKVQYTWTQSEASPCLCLEFQVYFSSLNALQTHTHSHTPWKSLAYRS